MNKKIVLTFLVCILIVVCEILVSSKFVNVYKDYDLKSAKELVDKFYSDNYIVSSNIFKDGMNDRYKISMAYNKISEKAKEYECKELYKDAKKDDQGIVVGDGTFCDGKVKGVSYKDLEEAYKSLFGKNKKLDKKTVGVFNYIKENDIFVYLSCRCGGVDNKIYIYDVKDAKIKGSNLVVNVYYYEYEPEKKDEKVDTKKFISENKDKMSTYKMKFVKEGKEFKLLKVEKVS